jgi:hypothetical protein
MFDITKAKLVCLENNALSWDFQYNPKEFTLSRSSGYQNIDKSEGPWGGLRAECSKADTLDFEVTLDQTEPDYGLLGNLALLAPVSSSMASAQSFANTDSVMEDVTKLYKLTLPGEDPKTGAKRPPLCAFVWGNFQFFGGLTDITVKFVLFDSKGLPRRADVTIKMLGQAMNVPGKKEELFGDYSESGYKYPSLSQFTASSVTSYGLRNMLLKIKMAEV